MELADPLVYGVQNRSIAIHRGVHRDERGGFYSRQALGIANIGIIAKTEAYPVHTDDTGLYQK